MPACDCARRKRGCIVRNTLEPSGTKMPRTAKLVRLCAERSAGDRRAFTEIMHLHKRAQAKIAIPDLGCPDSSRRTCFKSFLLIHLDRSNANSCSFGFRVLSGVSSIVSRLQLIDHPHQVRQFWNCMRSCESLGPPRADTAASEAGVNMFTTACLCNFLCNWSPHGPTSTVSTSLAHSRRRVG